MARSIGSCLNLFKSVVVTVLPSRCKICDRIEKLGSRVVLDGAAGAAGAAVFYSKSIKDYDFVKKRRLPVASGPILCRLKLSWMGEMC